MRNRYLERMDRLIKIRISGSNINNYLKRVIIKEKINVVRLISVSYREVIVILRDYDYEKLIGYKSIYNIEVVEYLGRKKVEDNFKNNFMLLFFLIIGFLLIVFLSNIVFSIDIIHQDSEIRDLLSKELNSNGIKRFSFKASYEELEEIEENILESNKDKLEWIEIDDYGTKYIVRVEERKVNSKDSEYQYQSIVSKKNAVIVKIDAIRGEKIKEVNDYVKKGDTVISGYIVRPDNSKVATKAEGTIYGEVWYEVDIDYPIVYQETNLTGKSKTVYVLYFFDKRIGFFDFDEYRSFQAKSKILVSSNLLNIKFVKEIQYEALVKDEVYTDDMAKIRAVDYIKEKLIKDNDDIIEIKDVKILDSNSDEDSIKFKLFVRAIESIGEVVLIDEIDENIDDN